MNTSAPAQGAPSLFGSAAVLMAGRSIGFAASFLTPVVLARHFSAAEFGTYKQLFLVFGTIFPIAQFGMAESLFYFLPEARAQAGRYVANSMAVLAGVGLVAAAALMLGGPQIARVLGNDTVQTHLPFIAVFCLLMLASAGFEIAITARGAYHRAAVVYGLGDIARAACMILPALLYQRLDFVLAGAVAYAAIRFAATIASALHTFGSALRLDRPLLLTQLAYGVPFGLAIVIEVAQANYHQYAVAHYFDATTFAIYSVGCLQIPFVDVIANSAGSVMMVQFAGAKREGREDRALEVWLDTTRKLALVFLPMAAVLLVVARGLIVALFTERYAASTSVFQVSLVTVVLSACATDAVLRAYGRTRFLMLLYAMKLGLVALLVGPCLTLLGLPGALLATVIALAASKAAALVHISRIFHCGWRVLPWRTLGAIALVAATAALAGFAVRWPLLGTPTAAMLASGVVTAGVSLALLLWTGLIHADEHASIIDWTRRTGTRIAGPGLVNRVRRIRAAAGWL